MTGSLETADTVARAVCAVLGVAVVSVDYRLAPEHPWPAGLNDASAVLAWISSTGDMTIDPTRIIVGGDSAGANLAAVLAHLSATGIGPALTAQLLLYPAVNLDPDPALYPSRTEKANGYGLTLDDIRTAFSTYAAGADVTDWTLSPIRAPTHLKLVPAVIAVAEHDPLRDEGRSYVEKLQAASVPVVLHEGVGLVHGCFDMIGISPAAHQELRRVLDSVQALLAT